MIGKTLAHYEVTAHLGAGGMGEVVRARDTKLGRDVALKILPEAVADDPERLARFQREAQLLASLNHPNIAAIHGVEQADGVRFLVMELVDGLDLQKRLRDGKLPLDDAIAIARGIAEGLEEAHERGVVHRDLKPANVVVSDAGKVKILDFGLARAYSGERSDEGDPALSPTITAAMTSAGTVLGSAAYMSPEQAKGREVDRRTDIWAFGVILYEMITGERLFDGETVSETMAAVLKDPIDLDALGDDVPPAIRSLLARCLERDPLQRLRDIGEARIHLDPSAATTIISGAAPRIEANESSPRGVAWIPWMLFAAASIAAAWFALARPEGQADDGALPPVLRFALEAPDGRSFHLSGANPGQVTLSPDGTRVVFAARPNSGAQSLWLHELRHEVAEEIPGTEGGQYPFWSPDGRSIGYYTGTELRVLELDARTNVGIATSTNGKGGAWLDDGTILFTRGSVDPIERLDVETGESTVLTDLTAEPVSNSHRHPRRLGNGHFLFAARPTDRSSEAPVAIMIGRLDGGPSRQLLRADGQAEFANGHILYGQGGMLYARPFDVQTLEFSGPASLVAEGVGLIPGAALSLLSTSQSGVVTFHPGERTTLLNHLTWFDVEGNVLGTLGEAAGFGSYDIAPDGRRVAFSSFDNRLGTGDLYVDDIETGVRTRLTFDPADEQFPRWSPDGRAIYYLASGPELREIRVMEPEGRGDPRVVLADSTLSNLGGISPDGRQLLFAVDNPGETQETLWALDLDGTGERFRVDPDAAYSTNGSFSPDGQWICYVVNDNGRFNLYLKTNPPGSRKWEISAMPAFWYDWDPRGDRIYHQFGSADVHATPVDLSGTSPSVGVTSLWIPNLQAPLSGLHHFQITPDGQRLLVSTGDNMDDERPVRFVFGWPEVVRAARP